MREGEIHHTLWYLAEATLERNVATVDCQYRLITKRRNLHSLPYIIAKTVLRSFLSENTITQRIDVRFLIRW